MSTIGFGAKCEMGGKIDYKFNSLLATPRLRLLMSRGGATRSDGARAS